MSPRRALHWVFKIGNRPETMDFLRSTLNMSVQRHEEFKEGCDAACNGPYDGMWSKTMIGYGNEDDNFVLELTYNYGIQNYKLGNDFLGLHIRDREVYRKVEGETVDEGVKRVTSSDGYAFLVSDADSGPAGKVSGISLSSTNLEKTTEFWCGILGLTAFSTSSNEVTLGFDQSQAFIRFVKTDSVDHATAYGRVAFAVPEEELAGAQSAAENAGHKVLTPMITLKTDGKADVSVVIFADPDGYEICFVGDTGFRDLSKVDPKGNELLDEAMEKDKSSEWFAKKGKKKGSA